MKKSNKIACIIQIFLILKPDFWSLMDGWNDEGVKDPGNTVTFTRTCRLTEAFISICAHLKATVLEEMPPFVERESSILSKLKKRKGPGLLPEQEDSPKDKNPGVNGTVESASSSGITKVAGYSIYPSYSAAFTAALSDILNFYF